MPDARALTDSSRMSDGHAIHVEAQDGLHGCGDTAMHGETIRAMARLARAVLSALDTYGSSGCPTCRENACALLAELRHVAVAPGGARAPERVDGPLAAPRLSH